MKDNVLIDTSVWIDFFRNKESSLRNQVIQLLRIRKAYYTGIIALELYRGARSKREIFILDKLFLSIDRISQRGETYKKAGLMGFELAKKGLTVSTVDLLIAQLALENNLTLFTLDQHFRSIANHYPLRVF
ncbi:MAG TPA: PIN domain nuclease [Syntrophaceae bacterium]|nr:PIN domain nuclease [Syntrophaceae bacterium]